jgi:hypothetical protein
MLASFGAAQPAMQTTTITKAPDPKGSGMQGTVQWVSSDAVE